MSCLLFIFTILAPRFVIFVLALFTNWFAGVFSGLLLPILGFFFLPATTLWYSVVHNYYGGQWGFGAVLCMIFCVLFDLGGGVSVSNKKTKE